MARDQNSRNIMVVTFLGCFATHSPDMKPKKLETHKCQQAQTKKFPRKAHSFYAKDQGRGSLEKKENSDNQCSTLAKQHSKKIKKEKKKKKTIPYPHPCQQSPNGEPTFPSSPGYNEAP